MDRKKKVKEKREKLSRKQVFRMLDEVKEQYEDLFENYKSNIERLDTVRESASSIVEDASITINSYASSHKNISSEYNTITANYMEYQSSKDLIKEEHKKDAADGLKGVLGIALAAGLAVSFKEFVLSKTKDEDNDNLKIVIFLILLFAFIFYWVFRVLKRKLMTTKKALKLIDEVKCEINSISLKQLQLTEIVQELDKLIDIVLRQHKHISTFRETDFRRLNREQRSDLIAFTNRVRAMSELLIKDI
jgi:hypothetical protein